MLFLRVDVLNDNFSAPEPHENGPNNATRLQIWGERTLHDLRSLIAGDAEILLSLGQQIPQVESSVGLDRQKLKPPEQCRKLFKLFEKFGGHATPPNSVLYRIGNKVGRLNFHTRSKPSLQEDAAYLLSA